MKKSIISAKKCMDIVKNDFNDKVAIDWHGVSIDVKKNISFDDMHKIVIGAVEACFNESGEYLPEVKEFFINAAIVSFYTNIELPKDTADCYMFVAASDIINAIESIANMNQITDIRRSVNDKLEYFVNTNIKAINSGINKVTDGITSIAESFSGLFDGVTNEDIANVMSAFADGKIDEEKLMNAYITSKSAIES